MSFLDVKNCIQHKDTEIRLPRMRAKYFRFLSQRNSALKITLAIRVPNLVKIAEKLRPLALTKEKISLLRKSIAAQFALIKSVLAIKSTVTKFGKARLKIEG